MNTESIFSPTELAALLTVVAIGEHMLYFYMVPHVCWLLTCVVTICALPQARGILPHFSFYSTAFFVSIPTHGHPSVGVHHASAVVILAIIVVAFFSIALVQGHRALVLFLHHVHALLFLVDHLLPLHRGDWLWWRISWF